MLNLNLTDAPVQLVQPKTSYTEASLETVETFATEIANRCGFSTDEWQCEIRNCSAEVDHIDMSGRRFRKVYTKTPMMTYQDQCIKLTISAVSDRAIEIFWLEVLSDRCNGVGTDMMNTILDIADDNGINVRVLPVNFDCGDGHPFKYLIWLRDWYKSFGFRPFSGFTQELEYRAK